jgi:hypothetical protein
MYFIQVGNRILNEWPDVFQARQWVYNNGGRDTIDYDTWVMPDGRLATLLDEIPF